MSSRPEVALAKHASPDRTRWFLANLTQSSCPVVCAGRLLNDHIDRAQQQHTSRTVVTQQQ